MKFQLSLISILVVCLNSFAQEEYKAATLYDRDNIRTNGFVLPKLSNRVLDYKKSLDQKEPATIKISKFKAIVIEKDSFVVLHNFKVESDMTGMNSASNFPVGLGLVLETGKLKLYKTYYSGSVMTKYTSGFGRDVYILQWSDSDKLTAIRMDIDSFVKQMSKFFKETPDFVERIQKKEYSYLKAQQMVADYNALFKNK